MPGWSRVAVVFVSCCVASPALALDVGLAPATQKILQDGVVPEGTSIALQACRGEWEGLQVVLLDDAGVSGVDLQLADLTGPDGARIPAADMRAYREWYLYIDDPSPGSVSLHEREVGWYPDPLIPLTDPWQEGAPVAAPFQLAAGETGAIFLDIPVAAGTPPGSYEGSITLLTDSQQVSLQVSLEVWELDIPADKTIGTAFHMSESVLRHFHGGADSEAAEGYDDIVDRYYIALHEHRLDPTWLGGAVDYSFDEEGVLQPVDWTEMDAALAPFLEGTLFPDGAPVTRFAVSGFQAGYGPGSRTEEEWAQEAAALAEHLDEEGWWSRFYSYSLDEPWLNGGDDAYQAIHDDAQLLMGASPLWEGHLLVTGPFDDRLAGDMGIWCPVTPMYEDWYWSVADYAGREEYAQRMALGEELWFYVCNANFPPYAGYDIDTPIGFEPRIVKWGSFYEGATGFLYWSTTYWVDDDPWNVYANLDQFGSLFARNGDGLLLYPGDHDGTAGGLGSPEGVSLDGPVVSYRLKQIRDGLEDWELFRLASELGGEDYVRQQVARAYARFGDMAVEDCIHEHHYCPDEQPWTLDEALLSQVRANVAAKALYLSFPDRYPDPEQEQDTGQAPSESGGCGCDASPFQRREMVDTLMLLAAMLFGWTRRRKEEGE